MPVTPALAWRARLVLLAPAAFLLLLSLEEVASIHERLEIRAGASAGGSAGYWPVLAGLALASAMTVMGVAYVRLVRPPLAALGKAAAGAVAFVGGATATDFVNNMLQDGRGLVLGSALEEGLELVGVTLLVWAALEVVAPETRRRPSAAGPRAGDAPPRWTPGGLRATPGPSGALTAPTLG